MSRNWIRQCASTMLIAVIMLIATVAAVPVVHAAGNPNPRIVPNHGHMYGELSADWWEWAFSFPRADIPFMNTGGPVDISAGQAGHVWFLAGANSGLQTPRTGTVPTGTKLFFPLANLINDFPCPDPTFRPDPGETLEHFLQRTGNEFLPNLTDLFAEIDGVALKGLATYRVTSSLFTFTADPAATDIDPCITGSSQFGVSVGYWLLVNPLPPGEHTLHFGSPTWGQDVTYQLTVVPRNRQ